MAYNSPRGSVSSDQFAASVSSLDERDRDAQRAALHASHYPPAKSDLSQSQSQPLHDAANAVNNAFDRSDAAARVDPALIAQITEEVRKQVIESLKDSGALAPQLQQPSTASLPARNVYTPPSPREVYSRSPVSPDGSLPTTEPFFDSKTETPTPIKQHVDRDEAARTVFASSHASNDLTPKPRPSPVVRAPTDLEATTVEKIWQPLFDGQQQPTPRLGQFLRGLAKHIVDDFEPKQSLVISPSKMLQFYEDVKLPDETFPWTSIWKLSNSTISKLFRDLRCEHHFIQDHVDRVPHIPALTQEGFRTWMTAQIIAYPDLEARRLAKAVLDMPISNADDVKERFPKELPRRLFPKNDNLQAQQRVCAAIACDGRISVPRSILPPPPPIQPQVGSYSSSYPSEPLTTTSTNSSYASSTAIADEDDYDDEVPPPIQIERERKPYTAKEGVGKFYANDMPNTCPPPRMDFDPPQPTSRHSRTQSFTNPPSRDYPPPPASQPPAGPRHYRANSTAVNGGRRRSPSFSASNTNIGGYARSDGNLENISSGYYTSNVNVFDGSEEEALRRRDLKRRQAADEEALRNGYNTQSRSIHDDDYQRGRNPTNGYGPPNGNGGGYRY